jgi:hypothetical protein
MLADATCNDLFLSKAGLVAGLRLPQRPGDSYISHFLLQKTDLAAQQTHSKTLNRS